MAVFAFNWGQWTVDFAADWGQADRFAADWGRQADREQRFRHEWEHMLALYGVVTRETNAKLHDSARNALARKLHAHGLSPVKAVLAMDPANPAAIVEALAPRDMLAKPADSHFGPAVTSEDEADFIRVRDGLIARHALAASIKPDHIVAELSGLVGDATEP